MESSRLCLFRRRRCGITLVEALAASTIAAVAGAALLTSIGNAIGTSSELTRISVAQGLAEQLMDEMESVRFPTQNAPANNRPRRNFETLDDYDGWSCSPPVDRQGYPLGTEGNTFWFFYVPRRPMMQPNPDFMARFTRSVEVERVLPDATSGWRVVTQHTNFRRCTVTVTYTDAQARTTPLAQISRVFSHVSLAP